MRNGLFFIGIFYFSGRLKAVVFIFSAQTRDHFLSLAQTDTFLMIKFTLAAQTDSFNIGAQMWIVSLNGVCN